MGLLERLSRLLPVRDAPPQYDSYTQSNGGYLEAGGQCSRCNKYQSKDLIFVTRHEAVCTSCWCDHTKENSRPRNEDEAVMMGFF